MSTRTKGLTLRPLASARRTPLTGSVVYLKSLYGIWRERQFLKRLDDHLLRDIGRSRSEAQAEAKRPAWDAPNRWLR